MTDYANLIETKVIELDNGTHNKTSTKRHLERLRDRVAEDMLADIPESGYVTKTQQQQYQSRLFPLDTPVHTNLWKNRLVNLDLLDLETGRSKEDRLKTDSIIVAKVHKKHKR